ncbi:eRF1 [Cryptosporidium tyzzeri]|nr:eRF1 [Cryptosporidium tyzzeri]
MEKRHNYLRKVAETATTMFITNDQVNVAALILAGSADFKNELAQSDIFDQRLASKILKIVDVSYGGDNGFNQAIELSSDALQNVKFVQEKKLITKFFDEVAQDTGKYVYGINETLQALEMGAIELLIVWENLETKRMVVKNPSTGEEKVFLNSPTEQHDESKFKDPETGAELDVIEILPLTEWLVNTYQNYGAQLEFVTNKSQEGNQFQKGFGGFGGILRYKVDFQDYAVVEDDLDEFI